MKPTTDHQTNTAFSSVVVERDYMNDTKQVAGQENQGDEARIVLLVRFTPKSGKRKEFLEGLGQLVGQMQDENSFIDATISESIDHPSELLMYETWLGSQESWLCDEFPRAYRSEYEGILGGLV